MAAKLQIDSGPQQGQTVEVTGERFLVGRGADGQLTLQDSEASRHHALMRPQPDGSVVLEDMGSTNGTFVNGQKVTGPVTLSGGEKVRMGDTEMTFTGGDDGRTRVTPPPDLAQAGAAAAAAGPAGAATPPAQAAAAASPSQPSPSRIERIMLRRSVNRAMILA